MRTRHLLSLFSFLFLCQWLQAQQMKPADPALRQRLMKYAADNHLAPGGTYIYWDSVTKQPIRFNAADYIVQQQRPVTHQPAAALPANTQRIMGAAANFHLVKDIETQTNSNPSNNSYYNSDPKFAVLNNVSYFRADDGIHGQELWRSDGTAAGTYLIKDISPGTSSGYPLDMTVSGGYVYFAASKDGTNDYSLWKTDGTDTGTVEIPLPQGDRVSYSPNFCDVNGTVYFVAFSASDASLLWKTNGTVAGTVLVKQFNASPPANLQNFVSTNGLLFFVANTQASGYEVWRSNGSDTGTYMLRNINTSNGYNLPTRLTAFNNLLYFSEGTGASSNNDYLWQTDGTIAGTAIATGFDTTSLTLVNAFSSFLLQIPFLVSNNQMYFTATTPATGEELYRYTPATGAVLINDFTQGSGSTYIYSDNMAAIGDTVYIVDGSYLFKTYGNGYYYVSSLSNDGSYVNVSGMTAANGRLYFIKQNEFYRYEPWTSDGTDAGTMKLPGLGIPLSGFDFSIFTACNGKVLFGATDSLHGNELRVTDGINTSLVADINTTATAGSNPNSLAPVSGGVFMTANTYNLGNEPWTSDGTDAKLVQDLAPGGANSYPSYVQSKNGFAYFTATTSINNYNPYNVYRTDGTAAGFSQVTSITLNPLINLFDFVVTDNGNVFYSVYNYSTQSNEVWKTDGTSAGTVRVKTGIGIRFFDVNQALNGSFGSRTLIASGNLVYFKAQQTSDGVTGLWRSDGTTTGTYSIKNNTQVSVMGADSSRIYFDDADGGGTGLWSSDGTVGGTVRLAGITPLEFGFAGGTAYISASTDSTGSELWKTDGTAAGTVQVSDIYKGTTGSQPTSFIDLNGTLFFTATDVEHGDELWKCDGTEAGTQLVKDITPGSGNTFYPYYVTNYFTTAASKLFFTVGGNIWTSNGSAEGTGAIVTDELNGLFTYNLTGSGNKLFFSAYTYQYSTELYEGDASFVVLPVTLTSFNALLKGTDVLTQWQTASETDTSYFSLQRSTDGIHFTDAGKVMAKGSNNTYSFTDVNIANLVSAKTIYYRLQTVDKDGSASLSKVVPVKLNLKDAVVLLLPNPVKDALTIRINNYTGKADICVFDANGKMVSCSQKMMQSGGDVTLNASSLQSGMYLVKISLDGKIIQQKFMKQ